MSTYVVTVDDCIVAELEGLKNARRRANAEKLKTSKPVRIHRIVAVVSKGVR